MKNSFIFLAIITFLLGITWLGKNSHGVSGYNSRMLPKEVLGNFPLRDINGKSYYLVQFRDHTIILHVWASWCMPCREEFPALIKAVKERKDVMLIAFSADRDEKAMRKFLGPLTKETPNMLMIWDKGGVIAEQRLGIISYPESYVLRSGLEQVAYFPGGVQNWSEVLDELGSKSTKH